MTAMSRLFAFLALGLAALVATAPAGAVDAAKPTPCGAVTDDAPADAPTYDANGQAPDSIQGQAIPGASKPSTPNMEETRFFFNYGPDKAGKDVLTANIQVKSLDQTIPSGDTGASGGVWYYAYYVHGGAVRFVRAAIQSDGVTYAYGTVDPDVGVYTTDGDTVGNLFEGPDGVVQIDVPEEAGGKLGETLKGVLATTETIEGQDDFFGINHQVDWSPTANPEDEPSVSEPNGIDYTVVACPAGGSTPAPAGTPAPGATPAPTTTPPSSGGGTPSGGGSQQTFTELPFRVQPSLGSAKKAAKKKKLTFKAAANADITNLVVQLKKGSKVVGSGKAATFKQGSGTFTLKVKKLKKGAYTLVSSGTVGGKTLKTTQKVSVKK